MKELWDEKGYAHFELKSQNLRDQASRLEKLQGCVMDDYVEDARAVSVDGANQSALSAAADFDYSQENFGDEDQNTSQNANFVTLSSCIPECPYLFALSISSSISSTSQPPRPSPLPRRFVFLVFF